MKTKSLLMLMFVILSCQTNIDNEQITNDNPISTDEKIKEIPTHKIKVINYDGCEYLIYKDEVDANTDYGFMAHKGNCSNSIHGHNKEKE